MYDYIQEAIDKGECLLEWDELHEGRPPPVPLLKDKFGGERRKAKVSFAQMQHIYSQDTCKGRMQQSDCVFDQGVYALRL
jgi:hypothetical protein